MGNFESRSAQNSNQNVNNNEGLTISSLTKKYENYLRAVSHLSFHHLDMELPKKQKFMSKLRKTLQQYHEEEMQRLNRVARCCGLQDFEKEEEKVLESNRKLRADLAKANKEKDELEKKNVALTAKLPMDPEEVKKIHEKMVEALTSFNKEEMRKKINQNYDDLLKSNPSLDRVGEAVQKISEFEKEANLFEYIISTNVKKIEESVYITPSDLLPIPEQPKLENFQFTLSQVQVAKDECSICLAEMEKDLKNLLFCPSCKQKFHKKCVGEWLKQCVACPLCRSPNELLRSYLETQIC